MLTNIQKRNLRSSDTTEADVREDEEQNKKYQEIIDLLVAAGYFRARIKGLSNFDKVIGGMTWCIESCSFDVDIDLLFRENLTIGQKISLTEKIVAMLPKMNCPYRLEPHQIQGLDCIHVFPVIQWLVKRSMETRKEMASFVRSFALNHFHKRHSFQDDIKHVALLKGNIAQHIQMIKKPYEPQRLLKCKDAFRKDDSIKYLCTVLEYEAHLSGLLQDFTSSTQATASTIPDENSRDENSLQSGKRKCAEEITENMVAVEANIGRLSMNAVGNIVYIQAQEIAKVAQKYAVSSGTDTDELDATSTARSLMTLHKQKATLQSRVSKLKKEKNNLFEELSKVTDRTINAQSRKEDIKRSAKKYVDMETNKSDSTLKRLEELLAINDGLKKQEYDFREQCKTNLNLLKNLLKEIESGSPDEEADRIKEYEEHKEAVAHIRLQLAKKNRAIASLTRQLDDVPGRSELSQYQRRFMELYNQVSAKHKETKQYYTLYNTLDDTKLYISKELSLLNSIQNNYNEAMASVSGKEQFLKQFEAIVDGIKRNKAKVEKRCADEKNRRDVLSRQLVTLIEQQRKYVMAVRQLTIECRNNEALLAQLRGP